MSPKNSVDLLPQPILDVAFEMLRAGKTVREITDKLQELGGEVSKSAVGRWRKGEAEALDAVKRTQAFGRAIGKSLEEDPQGRTGRMLIELAKTKLFNTLMHTPEGENGEEADPSTPQELRDLSLAIKNLEGAETISAERELKLKKEFAVAATKEVDKVAKTRGLSADAVAEIKAKILGIAA